MSIKSELLGKIKRDGMLDLKELEVYCNWKPCKQSTAERRLREIASEEEVETYYDGNYIQAWRLIK